MLVHFLQGFQFAKLCGGKVIYIRLAILSCLLLEIFTPCSGHQQSSHLAYTGAATGYCGDFYSQSGKIKDYILSFRSLFDNIHKEKHVL